MLVLKILCEHNQNIDACNNRNKLVNGYHHITVVDDIIIIIFTCKANQQWKHLFNTKELLFDGTVACRLNWMPEKESYTSEYSMENELK